MRKTIYLVLAFFWTCTVGMNAQVTIGSLNDPQKGAVLELNSSSKGFLLPRIALTNVETFQLDADGTYPASGAAGMVVYNTNSGITGGDGVGIYSWDGSRWSKTFESSSTRTLVASIAINGPSTVIMTESITLTAQMNPGTAANKGVIWFVSNGTGTADFNPTTGVLTGLTPGTVTVVAHTVDGSNLVATLLVTVTDGSTLTKIGHNFYKTYNYNGAVWMVENSREGTDFAATSYRMDPADANGFYYTQAQAFKANNACPTGWHLPSTIEWNALMTWVNDNIGPPLLPANPMHYAVRWWVTIAGNALAGYRDDVSPWGAWRTSGFWWSSSDSPVTGLRDYFVGTNFGDYPGIMIKNPDDNPNRSNECLSVRCVKNNP